MVFFLLQTPLVKQIPPNINRQLVSLKDWFALSILSHDHVLIITKMFRK